jgi:nitrogen fixation/metabolism regulation signal transduction histidine kinase
VKKIMEDHRGRIVLGDAQGGEGEGQGLGRGVRAELFLPAREAGILEGEVMERGHGA